MDEIIARHKKENKDLKNRITGMKKQATKSTRKHVMSTCNDLEEELKRRHDLEIKEFNNQGGPISEENKEDDEVTPEMLLNQLSIENDTPVSEKSSAPIQDSAAPKKRRNRQKERIAKREAELVKIRREAEEEALRQPDMKRMEQEALDELCHMKRLVPHDIKPDGHCLFASILDQLIIRHTIQEQELDVYKLRELCCDYISSHSDDFVPYLFDETTGELQNVDEYTNAMAKSAKWGGEIEILALSKVFNCPISILMNGRSTHVVNEAGEKPELKLIYYKHSYALGEHYNSLHDAQR